MAFTQALSQAQGLVGGLVKRASFYLPSGLSSSDSFGQASQKDVRIESLYIHPIKSCRGSQVSAAHLTHNGILYDRTWLIIDAATRRFCTARELAKMVLIVPRIDEERRLLCVDVPQPEGGVHTVETPLDPSEAELSQMDLVRGITIWVHTVDGYAVSPRADALLSAYFGKAVRLVRKGPTPRPSGPDDHRPTATLNFQDFYPLLIANRASMQHVQQTLIRNAYPQLGLQSFTADTEEVQDAIDDALVDSLTQTQVQAQSAAPSPPELRAADADEDRRLGGDIDIPLPDVKIPQGTNRAYWTPAQLAALPIRRFRPNIVLSSSPRRRLRNDEPDVPALAPWEEDGFTGIEVFEPSDEPAPYGREAVSRGKASINCVARCGRCLVPNVDPETGVRDAHLPYIPMQSFRQVEPSLRAVGKPCFGVMGALQERREGREEETVTLRVGDVVRITGTMDPEKRVATQHKKK